MTELDLTRVRESVSALLGEHRGLPVRDVVAVAALCNGARLTVDLAATEQVGFPIVLIEPRLPAEPQPPFLERLSTREREVARLIAAGRCNKEIAHALGISLGTVKDHVHAVLSKAGLSSRLEVASAFMLRR